MKIREILPTLFGVLGFALLAGPLPMNSHLNSAHGQEIDIAPSSSTTRINRVQTSLAGRGSVIPNEEETINLDLSASFQYDERVIARTKSLKSIRIYQTATAQIKLGKNTIHNQLDTKAGGLVIAQSNGSGHPVRLASIGQPLTQTEFELINTPANTLILADVFQKKSVKKGDSWRPAKNVLARFLNIDDVTTSDVEIKLESINNGIATLFIGGDIDGVIDGASTIIKLNGSAKFDVSKGIVNSCQFKISQQRDTGLMAPGLDAVFQISTTIKEQSSNAQLSDKGLADLRERAGSITDQLTLQPQGTFYRMIHPRQWRVITENANRTVMRYNDEGRMLGQCDIILLPPRLAGQTQTLEQFKQVVQNKLEDQAASITVADQGVLPSGLEWLRIQARGKSNDVDLTWTYYTISHQDGRRVQLVFTTEPAKQSSFAGLDTELIGQIQFSKSNAVPARKASTKKPAIRKTNKSG